MSERTPSGIWTVSMDPQLTPYELRQYNNFVSDLSGLPMGSRYMAMAARPFACFEAVEIWKRLGNLYPEF